uniref:Uncharacterized protein n=1 Tax=Anguilla anguilla TaxID=7936 RepID=A0A0E9SC19_ANGAN
MSGKESEWIGSARLQLGTAHPQRKQSINQSPLHVPKVLLRPGPKTRQHILKNIFTCVCVCVCMCMCVNRHTQLNIQYLKNVLLIYSAHCITLEKRPILFLRI